MSSLTLLCALTLCCFIIAVTGDQYKRVCYYTSWARYTNLNPEGIDSHLCTHILFAFGNIRHGTIVEDDQGEDGPNGLYARVMHLKQSNPALKVLLSIGGAATGKYFSPLVTSESTMQTFAINAINFVQLHNFDGLDIDWEFPKPEEITKFTTFLKHMRHAIDHDASHSGRTKLLLTGAFSGGRWQIGQSYDIPSFHQYMDFINLMTYDYHGTWSQAVGANSPLYAGSWEQGVYRDLNIDWAANEWVRQGVPKHKINIGFPTYARSFTLTNMNNKNAGAAFSGPGFAGATTKVPGSLAYYEVCDMIKRGATVGTLAGQEVPYLVLGNQWVSYDTPQSYKTKLTWLKTNGFGGAMVWDLHEDDVHGACGAGTFPLVKTIKKELTATLVPVGR